jgi:hypothetical protein
MLTAIFSAIPILIQPLSGTGVIPANAATLTDNLLTPVEALIAKLRSGTSSTADGLAALAAISGVTAVLQADTTLSPAMLAEVNNVDADVTAALKAYGLAGNGYNASLYTAIAPVV